MNIKGSNETSKKGTGSKSGEAMLNKKKGQKMNRKRQGPVGLAQNGVDGWPKWGSEKSTGLPWE